MTFEPKPLTEGWVKRCFQNTWKLILQSKREALLIYVLLPACTFFAPVITIKVVAILICFVFGMLFCLKQDKHQKSSWLELVSKFSQSTQLFIIVFLTALGTGYYFGGFFELSGTLEGGDMVMDFLAMPILCFLMYLSYLIASVIFIVFVAVCAGLYFAYLTLIKKKSFSEFEELEINKLDEFMIGGLPTFTFFICADSGLNWKESQEMNDKGMSKIRQSGHIKFLFICATFFLYTPLYIIGFPFLYAVYLEVFWDGQLSKKELKVSVDNTVYAQ